jgi:hypothetical protein
MHLLTTEISVIETGHDIGSFLLFFFFEVLVPFCKFRRDFSFHPFFDKVPDHESSLRVSKFQVNFFPKAKSLRVAPIRPSTASLNCSESFAVI